MEFENIPKEKRRKNMKYNFLSMKVNDSFVVKTDNKPRTQATLLNNAKYHCGNLGWEFSTQQVDGGVRIYRDK